MFLFTIFFSKKINKTKTQLVKKRKRKKNRKKNRKKKEKGKT